MRSIRRSGPLVGLLGLAACTGDFTPYNEIDRLRVLAISAERPWLTQGDRTGLQALVVPVGDNPVSYDWSWCPFTKGSTSGYECAVTRDELQAQIDQATGAPGLLVVPPFSLGTTSTTSFSYDLPSAFFAQVCAAIKAGGEIPAFVELPKCDGTFPITIRLHVTSGGEGLVAVKQIYVVYEDTLTLNTNPIIESLKVKGDGYAEATVVTDEPRLKLKRGVDYELEALLPLDAMGNPTQAEPYEFTPADGSGTKTVRETLVFTWFIEGGEMDRPRTGYIDGEVPIDEARKNLWSTPKKVDYERTTSRLFVVIQDNRKGVSWIGRTFELED